MVSGFRGVLRKIAGSILELDDTSVPFEQLEILNDLLSKHNFDLSSEDADTLLRELKRKHLVDCITVLDNSGQLVVSSEGNGNREALTASSLLRFVDSELATPESILIKAPREWLMLFPFNEKIYVVKAPSSLSNIELRAIARELESLLQKRRKMRQQVF